MKAFIAVLLSLIAIIVFVVASKPDYDDCLKIGKEIVERRLARKDPGYLNVSDTTLDSAAIHAPQKIIVKDIFFFKEVRYSWNGNDLLLGKAYLGAFHIWPDSLIQNK
jgi:hypothetical protein